MLKVVKRNNKLFAVKKEQTVFNSGGFTKVGSPDVTEDGVASGFSSGNYVYFSSGISSASKDYEINIPFVYPYETTINNRGFVITSFAVTNTGSYGITCIVFNGALYPFITTTEGKASKIGSAGKIYTNTNYILNIKRTETQYIFNVLDANTSEIITTVAIDNTADISQEALDAIKMGTQAYWSELAYRANYNLKNITCYQDNAKVFSGTKTTTKLFAVKKIRT